MASVQLVSDPRQAAMLAAPLRQRILEALAEPGSATTMARSLGLARQKVARLADIIGSYIEAPVATHAPPANVTAAERRPDEG